MSVFEASRQWIGGHVSRVDPTVVVAPTAVAAHVRLWSPVAPTSARSPDRIVSVHQPYVRPIVRGKSGIPVEFGPKLGLSLDNGYTRINTFSWDAYHESKDFKSSVEVYRKTHGHYPELVQVDAIYPTRENRDWAKEKGIRITAKPNYILSILNSLEENF